MLPYLHEHWGNASSIHAVGRRAKQAVGIARQQVANLLHCQPEEILFSSCGTASNNLACLGRARFLEANDRGRHLITSQIEHPSVMGPAKYLESRGWQVTYLPVNSEGLINLDLFEKSILPTTSMISILWANNEIGTVQPIKEMAEIAQHRQIYFHTDAVQAPGKLTIDLSLVPASTLSLSGHKFYAPKGIGVLFIAKGTNIMPIEFGGGQEGGLLPGTESVANIVGIGKAAELARHELANNQAKLIALQAALLKRLAHLPNIKITGPKNIADRLPGHVSIVVPSIEGEALVMRLDLQGICVSSGSACHVGVIEPSPVLKAIGLSNKEAMGSLRISFGKFNTAEECSIADEKLCSLLASLEDEKSTAARTA